MHYREFDDLLRESDVVLTPHARGANLGKLAERVGNGFANIERVARREAPLWGVPELR